MAEILLVVTWWFGGWFW